MIGRRISYWGCSRQITIALLTVSWIVFSLGVSADFSWQVGWQFLALALGFDVAQGLSDLRKRYYLFDAPLFSVGMLIFTVCDPLFAIAAGSDFPGVEDTLHPGNLIGNMTGLVVSTFCLSFFIGRLFVPMERVQAARVVDPHSRMKVTMLPILALATGISLFSFFANGSDFGIANLIWTVTARARGYVAFSSSGLGTDSPVVALFGQCIPTAIVLWLVSMTRRRTLWNVLAVLMSLGLFALYVLLGGRSGVIFVMLTIALFYTVRRHVAPRLGWLLLLGGAVMLILAFQANFRDSGDVGEGLFEHSPFRGFALNREVAFIVDTYGEKEEFVRGPSTLPRITLPLIDTLTVFITNPIPRKLWPDKPIDPSFGPYNEIRTGKTGFGASSNITPTIPGRFYISYGFWGVVQIGLVFGLLWRTFDRMMVNHPNLSSNRVLVGSMLNAIMFISLRDFTFGKFYPFIFLLFFIYLARIVIRNGVRSPVFRRGPYFTYSNFRGAKK